MSFPTTLRSLFLASALVSTILPAATAFELATRDAEGRYSLDNLLIGCTTHKDSQARIAALYSPRCAHDHSADEWVSFDKDPAIHPDIVDSIENIDKRIKAISGKVFIEHLNDWAEDRPIFSTYQGELLRKLAVLMKPGARLHMDFYPHVGLLMHSRHGLVCDDYTNSEYGVLEANGVDSRKNPFWIVASISHFALASQPGSPLDTWGGREAFLDDYEPILRADKGFLARTPTGLTAADLERSCKAMAGEHLARTIEEGPEHELLHCAEAFYRAKLRRPIIEFISGLGFQDVRIERWKVHPLNGRENQLLIVATQPEAKSGSAGVGETSSGVREEKQQKGFSWEDFLAATPGLQVGLLGQGKAR